MADSDFWRELAHDFLSVPKICEFTAYRFSYMRSHLEPTWQYHSDQIGLAAFDALARRGASKLPAPHTNDLLLVWLEALWQDATTGFVRATEEILGDVRIEDIQSGVVKASTVQVRGQIERAFQSSAAFCRKLESKAIQAAFDREQHDNPWNPWSHAEPRQQPKTAVRPPFAERVNIEPQGLIWKATAISIPSNQAPVKNERKPTRKRNKKRSQRNIPKTPTVGEQIHQLRCECNWTIAQLGIKVGLDETTVKRHLSGKQIPHFSTIIRYQQTFSKALKKEIVISKTP